MLIIENRAKVIKEDNNKTIPIINQLCQLQNMPEKSKHMIKGYGL